MSQPYAEVIGDPIAQSKSPVIHGFWLEQLGLEGRYNRTHVKAEGIADYLATRRADPDWRGCNVTMPHKQAVIPLLDRLDPLAARIGAVNTIVPEDGALVGYNTDAPGFLEPLQPLLAQTHYFRMARVLGTGGAARAIIAALADAGMVIVLAGRNVEKARALLDELDPEGEHHVAPLDHFADATDFAFDDRESCLDLVVNATALGMTGQPPLVFDMSHAPPGSVFYDIVTSPLETDFLKAAKASGFATVDGLSMLIGQADHAFRRFFDATPPRGEADAELRARLLA
ncbi:MAG: shikimate dehydrogenase [Novosphingobium sp. 32-60-15]|uniref:shikimate dehydrogenase n=1 Tax=unclassified Novosphingobium TaxID=2644732 RepID=UPI000BC9BC67|nr:MULTISPECIES: shikimate dehydrogenase [unclassified Novosphingobium]OYX61137.1 MAG: shikimate dehydrogenase [Novosphingobium sp. 32-60-15]